MLEPITWTNSTRKLSELIPWPINPAQIGKDEAKRLEESLAEFGQIQTIAISPTNEIYDGHQRQTVWGASRKFGMDYEVDVRVSSRELTEQERKKLVIYLRKGTVGSFDWDILANNFEIPDLLEWGFSEKELTGLDFGGEKPEDPGAQIDKAEELREKWGVCLGQSWQLGEHRLICGDCTDKAVVERVMGGEAGLVLSDPPYGVEIVKNNSVGGENLCPVGFYAPIVGDDTTETAERFYKACLENRLTDFVLWGGNYFSTFLPPRAGWIVWDKRGDIASNNFADCELAWTSRDAPARIHKQVWMGMIKEHENGKRLHPTQKPVELFEFCIRLFDKAVVFDGFLGSGTTLIACERLGRKCRAIEISPAYVSVALERWQQMTGGEPILLESDHAPDTSDPQA